MEILDKARDLLSGETARVIGYGAGVVVYLVAKATGMTDIPVDVALTATAAYVTILATVVETIRHFVYSPQSANDLLDMIAELQAELEDAREVPAAGAGVDEPEAPADPAEGNG